MIRCHVKECFRNIDTVCSDPNPCEEIAGMQDAWKNGNPFPDWPPKKQPDPQPGTRAIVPLVVADIEARRYKGISTYGRELEAHNGRDALWDAYEEALDLACYLRQAIEERKVIG